ncbi:MAG: hypothetical protein HY521_09020 [Proteobacteria bacterium]|nr:hypothetical protein [Pseudomonadota bacterium]
MTRLLFAGLLLAGLAGVALAQQAPVPAPARLQDLATAIREGKVDVGRKYDASDTKARFHVIHIETLGMSECSSCHTGRNYQPDYLLLRKEERLLKRAGGEIDRGACLSCHATGGIGSTWYVGRATR